MPRPKKHISQWADDIKQIWIDGAKLKGFKLQMNTIDAATAMRNQLYACRQAFTHTIETLPIYHKIKQFQIRRVGKTLIFTRKERVVVEKMEEIR